MSAKEYPIEVRKTRAGWEAESLVKIGDVAEGQRMLCLRTDRITGSLRTSARVFVLKPTGGRVYGLYEDFSDASVSRVACKRVTQKALSAQHQKVIESELPKLLAVVDQFYKHRAA